MPYRGLAVHHAREGGYGGGGSGLLDYWCNGGGGFRVTADPLLFIYSVSRLFVQT